MNGRQLRAARRGKRELLDLLAQPGEDFDPTTHQAPPGWTTWTATLSGDEIQIDASVPQEALRRWMSVDVGLFAQAEVEQPALKSALPKVSFVPGGLLIAGDSYRVKSSSGESAAKALDVASYSDWTEIPK